MTPAADTAAAVRAFVSRPRPLPLEGAVRHNEWGGREFIPGLLGRANPDGRPFAELWMGAHPRAPAAALVIGLAATRSFHDQRPIELAEIR